MSYRAFILSLAIFSRPLIKRFVYRSCFSNCEDYFCASWIWESDDPNIKPQEDECLSKKLTLLESCRFCRVLVTYTPIGIVVPVCLVLVNNLPQMLVKCPIKPLNHSVGLSMQKRCPGHVYDVITRTFVYVSTLWNENSLRRVNELWCLRLHFY